jgi:hypothetical protein
MGLWIKDSMDARFNLSNTAHPADKKINRRDPPVVGPAPIIRS